MNKNQEYSNRINKVLDYIENHLSEELSLEVLAREACFSKYHFHRVFHAFIGETLSQFIQRVRLQKAASLLQNQPSKSITQIAFECGFTNSASFARAFREIYQMSASKWRTSKHAENSNISKAFDNLCKEFSVTLHYIDNRNIIQLGRISMNNHEFGTVEVKQIDAFSVIYLRHIGSYKELGKKMKSMITQLMNWAGSKGVLNFPHTKLMAVYHDDPHNSDPEKLRTSICLSVDDSVVPEGEIGKMQISGGQYAIGHFEIGDDEISKAWDSLFGAWMCESGFEPDDGPCFEVYLNNPQEHPDKKHILEIYVPVKPMV